ncbi:bifunctional DNA primase/polymerase [Thermus thermophilus]|uniref:bifunctional DNA primase/polymerase n=1 Tax=Thermus thermophilus TaxID=274 RepID=UPI001FCBE79B|nr:bifunctional DNA primase/polymerase [Thermus thermophilus]BDG23727.1 hypothetical protein TthSNM33_09210 [Thermus thermophilus]
MQCTKYTTSVVFVRRYLSYGYRALPLLPGEKRPHPGLVPHGLKDATGDLATLEVWWQACPECGVGLLPGPEVLVLDVDAPGAWERLKEEHPALLEAPRARTPRGGVHIYLRLPPEAVGRLTATTKALSGVDLRGLGRSYLVAPPTTLPTGAYAWEVALRRPEELPLVPDALLARLLPPPPPPREVWTPVEGASPARLRALLEAYCHRVAATPPGQRHNVLVRYSVAAGGLIPHGLDPGEAEAVLVGAALEAGLPEKEARAAVEWGLGVGASRPLTLGDFGQEGGFWAKPFAQNQRRPGRHFSDFGQRGTHNKTPWEVPTPWGGEGGGPWR